VLLCLAVGVSTAGSASCSATRPTADQQNVTAFQPVSRSFIPHQNAHRSKACLTLDGALPDVRIDHARNSRRVAWFYVALDKNLIPMSTFANSNQFSQEERATAEAIERRQLQANRARLSLATRNQLTRLSKDCSIRFDEYIFFPEKR
jgi:hypothetical protein